MRGREPARNSASKRRQTGSISSATPTYQGLVSPGESALIARSPFPISGEIAFPELLDRGLVAGRKLVDPVGDQPWRRHGRRAPMSRPGARCTASLGVGSAAYKDVMADVGAHGPSDVLNGPWGVSV